MQGAFFGAGKNRSASVFLTEDEHRDRYDNIDERIGTHWGPFALNPAGLTIYDLSIGYEVTSVYRPKLVIAGATNINPNRAWDERFVGAEVSLLNRFQLSSSTDAYLNALVFLPGKAAAAFVNDVILHASRVFPETKQQWTNQRAPTFCAFWAGTQTGSCSKSR